MGSMRDICAWNPVDIIQFNRGVETYSRNRVIAKGAKDTELTISSADFKGSGDGYENCDLALGLLNPYQLNEMAYGGYKIEKFIAEGNENRFRSLSIVKNSYGVDSSSFGLLFIGENGFCTQLPTSTEMNRDNSYEDYRNASRELLLN